MCTGPVGRFSGQQMPFVLDARLEADTATVADLRLSTVRLMRDATYPWLILIPRKPALVELTDLSSTDRHRLMDEIAQAGEALRAVTAVDKLNIAALGNKVRQLHVHVIARRVGDPAWPNPVWGTAPARDYEAAELESLIERLRAALAD